jgi:hypothetical protein
VRSRAGRVSLALALAALVAGAGYRAIQLDTRQAADDGAIEAVAGRSRDALLTIARLGAAQRSYMAGGRALDYWTAQVTNILAGLGTELERYEELVVDDDAVQAARSARSITVDLGKLDLTIREHLDSAERLLASDLIFTDATQLLDQMSGHVRAAETATIERLEQRITSARRETRALLSAAVVLLVLGLLFFAWVPARRASNDPVQSAVDVGDDLPLTMPPPARPEEGRASLQMSEVAELCAELARAADPAQLDAALARGAHLLEARGVVLWLADARGSELRPAAAHGYSPHDLSRLGLIPVAADNAAATAFRDTVFVTVPAGDGPHGALVAPLLGPTGCTGVLSVEVPAGRERDEHAQALVRILAAQLSGLVAAPPSARPAAARV